MNSQNNNNLREKAADEAFCTSCGTVIKKAAEICPHCGVRQKGRILTSDVSMNWLTLLLLSIFLGIFGIDRFYAGRIGTGILKLITGSFCGVWWIIDLVLILTDKFKDSRGNVIRRESRA
ncbi:MAG: TM2 domain-containing protein [Chitinispirillia bacterium]|nr:TM2 domain-containing protein [Chitinispirillia bacterium]MCL2269304.1 TM2 domain-containing protein [Chitinispirillia bacterium]